MSSETQKILTTDGIPLEVSLKKAEKKNKIKAFLLVAPLLLFIIITYIFPIGEMFTRSIDDRMVTNMLPKTFKAMETWDGKELPPEKVFGSIFVIILSSMLLLNISPIGNTYVMIKNKSNGATRRNALILFFFSAFFKLTSKGIPSVVNICFVSELIKK